MAPRPKDPVCGMEIDEAKAQATGRVGEFARSTHYFCCDTRKRSFDKDRAQCAGVGSRLAKHAGPAAGGVTQ
jgi:YHS domain-containing protein